MLTPINITESTDQFRPKQVRLMMFCGLALMALAPAGAAASSCPPSHKVDYLAPLEQMAPLRSIPADWSLAFAPKELTVGPTTMPLIAGGGRIGISIEAPKGTYELGWTIKMTLATVNSRGTPIAASLRRKVRHLARKRSFWQEPVSIAFGVGGEPAFYRTDLTIIGADGRVLGRYGWYTRAMRKRFDLELALGSKTYRPGETATARVRNRSTVGITSGIGLYLERWEGSEWVDTSKPTESLVGPAFDLLAGRSGSCERIPLADDLSAGHYRFAKSIAAYGKSLLFSAPFELK